MGDVSREVVGLLPHVMADRGVPGTDAGAAAGVGGDRSEHLRVVHRERAHALLADIPHQLGAASDHLADALRHASVSVRCLQTHTRLVEFNNCSAR